MIYSIKSFESSGDNNIQVFFASPASSVFMKELSIWKKSDAAGSLVSLNLKEFIEWYLIVNNVSLVSILQFWYAPLWKQNRALMGVSIEARSTSTASTQDQEFWEDRIFSRYVYYLFCVREHGGSRTEWMLVRWTEWILASIQNDRCSTIRFWLCISLRSRW